MAGEDSISAGGTSGCHRPQWPDSVEKPDQYQAYNGSLMYNQTIDSEGVQQNDGASKGGPEPVVLQLQPG